MLLYDVTKKLALLVSQDPVQGSAGTTAVSAGATARRRRTMETKVELNGAR